MADTEEKKTEEGQGTGEKPSGSPVKLILLILVPVLVIFIGAAVVLFLTPVGKNLLGHGEESAHKEKKKMNHEDKEHPAYVYYDLPDILVNIINKNSKRPIFLKLSVYLAIKDDKEKPNLDKIKPKILDQFQVYLRGLRLEELQGSAGIQKLRADLLQRAQEASAPTEIYDVLFKEMLIQ